MRKSKYSPSSRSLSSTPVPQASFEEKKSEKSSLLYGFPIHMLIYTFKKCYTEDDPLFANLKLSLTTDKFALV